MIEVFRSANFSFQNPEFLFLLLLIPLLSILYFFREYRGNTPALIFSSISILKSARGGVLKNFRHSVFVLRMIVLALLILAFARPRTSNQKQIVYSEGIDIVLCLDLSTSMFAEDFEPKNRIDAAKDVAREFIRNRVSDRIGLVIFQAKAFTQCPLTLDYSLLNRFIAGLRAGQMQEDGTAIGLALATATNRLRTSTAKSKLIILLTDGQNNAGEIEPQTAADLASALGIKVNN
jgi:Ca-activated chloride channel family protein